MFNDKERKKDDEKTFKEVFDKMYTGCIQSIQESAKELNIESYDEDTTKLLANELVKLLVYTEARFEDLLARINVLQSLCLATTVSISARDPEEAAAEMSEIAEYIETLIKRKGK